MTHRLRIGLAFDPAVLYGRQNASALRRLDVLMFPELVDGGYAALERGEGLHRIGDPYWQAFCDASKRFSLCCISGSMILDHGRGRRTNASHVFSGGRLLHRYDKLHLFAPTGDHRYFTRGREIRTFTIVRKGMRIKAGLILCYDVRFPELIRAMALRGIQVLFVPARWPASRDHAWRTLLQARAIENQVFVVGCNSGDREGGYSYVVDPLGSILFSSADAPQAQLHTVVLDLGQAVKAKELHSNLHDAVVLRHATLPRILPAARPVRHRGG